MQYEKLQYNISVNPWCGHLLRLFYEQSLIWARVENYKYIYRYLAPPGCFPGLYDFYTDPKEKKLFIIREFRPRVMVCLSINKWQCQLSGDKILLPGYFDCIILNIHIHIHTSPFPKDNNGIPTGIYSMIIYV